MASSLMSLMNSVTIKHVVPWKFREEFMSVYSDLFSNNEGLQQASIHRINMWKSRAGSKLSVAIECSACLTQVHLDYIAAKREERLAQSDFQLRSGFSLALIRFVNHITEKGQTKAVAQPVHLVAKEFDIPEWIVRLRHDATHNSLPSLDTLVAGATWARNYLKEQFWEVQTNEETDIDGNLDAVIKGPKTSDVRTAIYDFQKIRFQELGNKEEEKTKEEQNHTDCLKILQTFLTQNRLKFLKCFLEDGVLVATEEQLSAFGVKAEDLLARLPPMIPQEMTEFWHPLLKKIHSSGALALLLQTIMFSITSGEGLRNYQLVSWMMHLLAQGADAKGRKKRKRKHDDLFKSPPTLPKKMLLNVCLQNVNSYTAYLLQYLVDKETLGQTAYSKLTKLLSIHTGTATHNTSGGSDSDTVYTVEDVKKANLKDNIGKGFSESAVSQIESTVERSKIPWKICTDLVDWSTVPIGTIPSTREEDDEESEQDEKGSTIKEDYARSDEGAPSAKTRGRLTTERSSDEEEDMEAKDE